MWSVLGCTWLLHHLLSYAHAHAHIICITFHIWHFRCLSRILNNGHNNTTNHITKDFAKKKSHSYSTRTYVIICFHFSHTHFANWVCTHSQSNWKMCIKLRMNVPYNIWLSLSLCHSIHRGKTIEWFWHTRKVDC